MALRPIQGETPTEGDTVLEVERLQSVERGRKGGRVGK
jgi:hypothetical protein